MGSCFIASFLVVFVIHGAVAQLGERCVRNAEVESSNLFRSTLKSIDENSTLFTCRRSAVRLSSGP